MAELTANVFILQLYEVMKEVDGQVQQVQQVGTPSSLL